MSSMWLYTRDQKRYIKMNIRIKGIVTADDKPDYVDFTMGNDQLIEAVKLWLFRNTDETLEEVDISKIEPAK